MYIVQGYMDIFTREVRIRREGACSVVNNESEFHGVRFKDHAEWDCSHSL